MKKVLMPLLGLTMSLSVSGCGVEAKPISGDKVLIVYFSRPGENYGVGTVSVGNTAIMASYIQESTGGDLFEIVPVEPYPSDYEKTKTISQQEIKDDARPAIKGKIDDIDKYDVVFVGAPIWYGVPPKVVETFYDAYPELAGKILIPFGTHEGSGVEGCVSVMKKHFPKSTIKDVLGLRGVDVRNSVDKSKAQVKQWVDKVVNN